MQKSKIKNQKSVEKYNPLETESKWRKIWEKEKIYSPNLDTAKKPAYNLMMFPYPSAEGMHVGNMYAFTGADVYGRFQRMQGKDVFEPIGLDGFGIHSENYAIKQGVHPAEQAKISERNFYRQLKSIGNGFDWTRTVETYKPEYYKWTQWLFIQLFKAGLAYRKKAPVNFCPSCKTVLADEQVVVKVKSQKAKLKTTAQNSKIGVDPRLNQRKSAEEKIEELVINVCERCESEVVKKDMEQWFFKITKYADRLLDGLSRIDWAEKVKIAQRQWIGRSEGARVNFELSKITNYVLLHGFTGSADVNFFPWLKKELEAKGHKVYAPNMPNTNDPDIDEQVNFVLSNAEFDENTILFGHSLGCVVALKVAEKLKKPIKKLVLAAGFVQPNFLDKIRSFEKKFDWKFDFEKIKKNIKEVVILRAKNDTAVPQKRSEHIREKIGGEIVDFIAEDDHICGEKEPIVLNNLVEKIEVFTTRPDTLFGATFLVLSPEHALVASLDSSKVKGYLKLIKGKSDQARLAAEKGKTGVFSGLYAINPVNNEKIPVWIADYVLMGYGTGAIMAVPAHDGRDFRFVHEVIKDPNLIKEVILNDLVKKIKESDVTLFEGKGIIKNSNEWNGWDSSRDMSKVISWLEKNGLGKKESNYHLRDWLISRQRYWGPPIPMIFCGSCAKRGQSWFSLKEKDSEGMGISSAKRADQISNSEEMAGWYPDENLPVELPYIEDYKPLGTGAAPLASHPEFYKTKCPNCGGEAKRETDVSDTFLDSAWYFLKYVSTDIDTTAFDLERVKKWLPVNMYIGGAEHSVLHLLYARFITMALKDLGLISFEEPFVKFRAHGLIVKDGAKMSKSRGNVVIPDKYIKKFGADTVRAYLMFMGPFNQGGDFRDSGIEGMHRFLKRIWSLVVSRLSLVKEAKDQRPQSKDQLRMMHKTIKRVTEDVEGLSYNTAIAALMEWYNFLSDQESVSQEEIETFLKLLSPFAPHISEELYQLLIPIQNNFSSIHTSQWPQYDPKFLETSEFIIVVQINGKLRGNIAIDKETLKDREKVTGLAKKNIKVIKYLEGKQIKKVIYIEGKVINFVAQ